MQPDRTTKRENRDGASNATKHAHETRERLPIRQSTPAGSNASESVGADVWIAGSLQPNSYPDIATNHYLWSVRRGRRGGRIAYSFVRGKLPRNIDPRSRARGIGGSHGSRKFIGGACA